MNLRTRTISSMENPSIRLVVSRVASRCITLHTRFPVEEQQYRGLLVDLEKLPGVSRIEVMGKYEVVIHPGKLFQSVGERVARLVEDFAIAHQFSMEVFGQV